MNAMQLEETVVELLRLAVTTLPQDVIDQLQYSLKTETNPTAKSQLKTILENIKLAKKHSIPMCQDTGIPIFYISAGSQFPLLENIPQIVVKAVRRATKEIPLRPNTVDPIEHENPGNNTGYFIPWINWKIIKSCKANGLWFCCKRYVDI